MPLEESLQTQKSDSSSVTMTLCSTSMLSSPTYAKVQALSDQSDRGLVRSDRSGPMVQRGIGSDLNPTNNSCKLQILSTGPPNFIHCCLQD
jgi:hypothetical protein